MIAPLAIIAVMIIIIAVCMIVSEVKQIWRIKDTARRRIGL